MTKPIMSIDDEIARLHQMNNDLRVFTKDFDRILAERDRYKEALEQIRRKSPDKYAADRAYDALQP